MKKILLISAIVLLSATYVQAQVTLCPVFSDNMVLQRNTDNAPVWGQAKAGKMIKITTSWDNQTYVARADQDGKWNTSVKTPDAGGPYTITISDGSKKKVVLQNVMIGEVWLCSGQSNMEMPIEGWGKVNNYKAEEQEANNYGDIRLLTITHVTSPIPLDSMYVDGDSWKVCNAENVAPFSSTAYFFGRELYKQYNVPIGLINSSWGGTIIEAWMSKEAFEGIPDQEQNLKNIENLPATTNGRKALFMEQYSAWLDETNKIISKDDVNIDSYTSATFDDSAWKSYSMPSTGNYEGTINTVWWARTVVDIPQAWAGKEIVLNLGKIDDNDVTYFDGKQVGSTVGYSINRNYTVPADLVKAGKVALAIRIHDTGGESGINCDVKNFNITLAGTNETLPLAGEWKYKTAISSSALPPIPKNMGSDPNVHTFLYNAMINPIVPYTIRGSIWYQGEANVSQAYQYRDLMPMLIHNWRTKWGYDFPFFMVQLANYMKRVDHPQESVWAELREAQYKTRCDMAGVGMATIIDIGEANDIHPKNKQEVGHRLALAARNMAYGEKIPFEGPLYRAFRMEGDKIRILFTPSTSEGIKTSDGGALKGFEIAGADHVWHRAEAEISDKSVVVSSPDVPFPMAVRYAWADNPECNLTNSTGLPASPFSTDEWKRLTYGSTR